MNTKIGLACHPAGEGPAYEHDCDQCRFVGQVSATPFGRNANAADVYYCTAAHSFPQVGMLVRFSSRPGDYWTERQRVDAWSVFPTSSEAAQLLRDRGLIKFTPPARRHSSRILAA